MRKLSTTIVGLGNIGFLYDLKKKSTLTHAKAIKNSKNFYITSGIDKNKKRLKKFKKLYNVNTYTSFQKSLEIDKPKFVVISTKISSIYKICLKAIKYNSTKYIMIEKPGPKNINELQKLISLSKIYKKFLFINYFRLFNPQFNSLKKKIKNSKNFRIVFFYSRGMYNNTSHLISFLLTVLDNPIDMEVLKKDFSKKKDINPDFRIKFKKGDITFLGTNIKNLSYLKLIFLSDKEKIVSNNSFNNFIYNKSENDSYIKDSVTYSKNTKLMNIDFSNSQKIVYDNLLSFCDKKKYKKLIKIYLKTIEILDKIKKYNEKKK